MELFYREDIWNYTAHPMDTQCQGLLNNVPKCHYASCRWAEYRGAIAFCFECMQENTEVALTRNCPIRFRTYLLLLKCPLAIFWNVSDVGTYGPTT